MSIIVAFWSSYILQSRKIYFSIYSPPPHSPSAVDTMLILLKLSVRLVCPALIRFTDTTTLWFIFILRNQGTTFQRSFLLYPFWCSDRNCEVLLSFFCIGLWILSLVIRNSRLSVPSLAACFASESAVSLIPTLQRFGIQSAVSIFRVEQTKSSPEHWGSRIRWNFSTYLPELPHVLK